MNKNRMIVAALTAAMAGTAMAGSIVPLGAPLGTSLGVALGAILGTPLGFVLPVAAGGLLFVGAASLVAGIWIVRRKQNR